MKLAALWTAALCVGCGGSVAADETTGGTGGATGGSPGTGGAPEGGGGSVHDPLQWSKRFGGASFDPACCLAVDGADVIVSGAVILAKYDSAGNHLWSLRAGGADSEYPQAVATDSASFVFVTGSFFGAVDFGGGTLTSAGESDIFLAKFSP